MPTPKPTPDRRRARPPRLSEHFYLVLLAAVCGLLAAGGAVVLRSLIRWVQDTLFVAVPEALGLAAGALPRGADDPLHAAQLLPWYWVVAAPAIGAALAAPLIYYLAREAKGHGVPEVMEAVIVRGGWIRARVAVVKAVASGLTIGSGGAAGREGPIVQIGSAIGSTLGQLLRLPARHLRTLVGCGAAAGIAAAFNAPIAGALFAVEIILQNFAVGQFSPIVIASVVATVVSRAVYGNHPAFVVPGYELVSPLELGPYMLVGMACGVVAVAFIVSLYATEDFFERVRIPELLKLPIGGAMVGAIGIFLPHVFGVGYTTINAALVGELPALLLGGLLLAKIAATSLTLGSGGSGGVFAPSLFLGAVTGGFLGTFVHGLFPEWTAGSGAYALVAMGAVVAAATHAPITAIIMIFELTQKIEIIPPLMAACVISTLVSSFLLRDSIYTLKLRRRGVELPSEQDPNVLKRLFVRDVIDREPEVIPASASFNEVLDLVVRSPHTEFFVVDEKGELLGAISLSEVRRLILEQDALRDVVVAADLVETGRPVVTENDDLDLVMQLFSRTGVGALAVVAPNNPRRLVGVVHEKDVIEAYNREILRRDLVSGMSTRVALAQRGQRVDLGGGFVLTQIEVPHRWVGRSLRELDLRATTGIHVLLVRRRQPSGGEAEIRVPGPEDRLREGDMIVIAGPEEAVDRLQRA